MSFKPLFQEIERFVEDMVGELTFSEFRKMLFP